MTLIFPIVDKENSLASTANWNLCNYIKKFILEKNGDAEISRKSDNAPEVNPLILKSSLSPKVYIQVKSGYVGDPYIIEAANYSALVGALSYELFLYNNKPEGIPGISIRNDDCSVGETNDIAINLQDISSLTDEEIQSLAKRLVEGAFWPPIKVKYDKDTPGNIDPYFLRFSSPETWSPETSIFYPGHDISQCTGKIENDDSDKDHPISYLNLTSSFTEETIPKQHYTWKIPVEASGSKLILNVKGNNVTLYIKVGESGAPYEAKPTKYKDYTEVINSTTFIKKTYDIPNSITVETVEIGIQGNGTIGITAVWITDTDTNYNIYPQGYRDELTPEKQEQVPETPIPAITTKTTLEERDAEKIEAEPKPQEEEASESPTGGAAIDSPEGFGNALSGVLGQATNTAEDAGGVINLNNIMKLDTSVMQDKIKNASNFASKINLSKAKDKLDGLKSGAEQQAKALINSAKDKLKGKNFVLSTDKLKNVTSKIGGLMSKAKSATSQATAGLNSIKDAAKNKAAALQDNATKLTAGLQEQANKAKSSASSKLATVKAQADAAKAATDKVNATKDKMQSVATNKINEVKSSS